MSTKRLPWLLAALAGTAGWTAFGETPAQPVEVAARAIEAPPTIRVLLPRSSPSAAISDPFALPLAQPTTDEIAVPPGPTLPVLPGWHCIGKQRDAGNDWSVFLARGAETRVVRVGDTLDDMYRVAAIAPPTLTLQHMSTRTRHTIDIGASPA